MPPTLSDNIRPSDGHLYTHGITSVSGRITLALRNRGNSQPATATLNSNLCMQNQTLSTARLHATQGMTAGCISASSLAQIAPTTSLLPSMLLMKQLPAMGPGMGTSRLYGPHTQRPLPFLPMPCMPCNGNAGIPCVLTWKTHHQHSVLWFSHGTQNQPTGFPTH